MLAKELTHHLDPHQVPQQRVNCDHLEQQERPSHEHPHITAGEVI